MKLLLVCWLALSVQTSAAFSVGHGSSTTTTTTTALSALPPPMIIGPAIKKMQEEQQKKNQPLVDQSETVGQAPGLKVGAGTWKWPAGWPYDNSVFVSTAEAQVTQKQGQLNELTSMLSGVAQLPQADDDEQQQEVLFDPLTFWETQETPPMDPEAAEQLRAHYAFYLRDDMNILELGAGQESYLPFQPKRHVGVSASPAAMKDNPSLTETLVVDLNKVVKDRDVDSDDLRRLAQEPFDAVVMANTVEYLTHPRETFRSAWYLLKPGGTMLVAFMGNQATKAKYKEALTKIWTQYNDDQHMWMTGSFFQFSAGDGWESLLGFDISPESAKQANEGPLKRFMNQGKLGSLVFVVQATKGSQDDSINMDNVERSINSLCWMLPVMEDRDKKLVVPRLTRAVETCEDNQVVQAIEKNIEHLPTIYESLINMDQFAFTFNMQAQLAADLVCDPDFEANEKQMLSLKEGLGLRTPGEEFWKPVGENTSAMDIEDKISLLSYVVPRFGLDNPAQEEALQAFVTGLKPTYAVIRSKCPDLSESDVQLIGTELLAAEVVKPGWTTREEYAVWLANLTESEIRELLAFRKSIRANAKEELDAYRKSREEEKKRIEDMRNKMEEQIEKARNERSLYFNPRTEKMEVFDNPNKK